MTTTRSGSWRRAAALAGTIGLLAMLIASCGGTSTGGGMPAGASLGQQCVPKEEYQTSFSGFDDDEVTVGVGNPACDSGAVCLVNHFRGRVSCPYGQTQADIDTLPGDGERRCALPNASGADPLQRVTVPVRPQLEERQAEDAVYCTCRCGDANGNGGAGYCVCPTGFSCEPVVEDLGFGSEVAGSYCIKDGTEWDETAPPGPSCNALEQDCGSPRPEFDVPAPDPAATSTNQFVEAITRNAIDKLDILLMVDNSMSMADKQELLSQSLPGLLGRFIDPLCQDADGAFTARSGGGVCPAGTSEQFAPLTDIHLGVVSSSLGGHGGVLCSPAIGDAFLATQDDRGELVAPLRGLASYDDLGFLKWDPDAKYTPAGEDSSADFLASATDLIAAVGEEGCGYEAGLEAWYRFLIDPQPPIEVVSDGSTSVLGAINTTVLEQRAWFLRPDSVVVIVMLADENDCSIRDDGVSWLIGDQTRRIPRGTEACLINPNDPCCRSCALSEAAPPSGCASLADNPHCMLGSYQPTEESLNLRCFDQKRRFGIDFLYPWARYVDGLKLPAVLGRECFVDADCPGNHPTQAPGSCVDLGEAKHCEYPNPLNTPNDNYPTLIPRADSSLVFLAGIVGVPWQDIATESSLASPNELEFLRAVEDRNDPGAPTLADRWDAIVGNPDNYVPPDDPFMVESIDPRDALGPNPITGEVPAPVSSPVGASSINGHEYTIPQRDDLQYACIFPLGTTRDCATYSGACDCKQIDTGSQDRPLCQAPGTTNFGTTQHYAKAYPGTRYLKVLREYGANSIVASVCPKITDPARVSEGGYGYNPAMRAIIDRVSEKLGGSCLPRALPTNPDGTLACQVVEATNPTDGVSCDTVGRRPLDGPLDEAVRQQLAAMGRCGSAAGQLECDSVTLCSILPAETQGLEACTTTPDVLLGDGPLAGYCYIDAMQERDGNPNTSCVDSGDPDCIGDPELVADCDPSQRRILRLVSRGVTPEVPFGTATLVVACESTTAL